MNTRIVAIFHPFDLKQDVLVYENDCCVKELHPTLNNISNTIYGLNKEYKIDQIDMCGDPSFVNKFITELRPKFSKSPAIEIIKR